MCMGKDTVLNSVFDRLKEAHDKFEHGMGKNDGIEFARCKKYGYVTSSPENLGTGLHVSVLAKMPNLTVAEAKAAVETLALTARRAQVKSGSVIDLTPTQGIFTTEAEMIASLYDGIAALHMKDTEVRCLISHRAKFVG